ncbi:MAG: cyclic nucleotide-binding domain-containing protein [Magnetococcales bacterium]|nr:cyclic nucleotide-binding domain-containing protein [Magnetococcales bacterium]
MMDATKKIAFLQQQPFHDDLIPELLEEMAETLSWRIVLAGEQVIQEGERSDLFFWVHTGRFVVTRDDRVVGWVDAGDMVGEIGLLGQQTPAATLTAVQDALLLVSHQEAIQALMERSSAFALTLAKQAVQRLTSRQLTGRSETAMRLVLLPLFDDSDLLQQIVDAMGSHLSDSRVIDADHVARELAFDPSGDWSEQQHAHLITSLAERERESEHTLLIANTENDAWTRFCLRQSERRVVVSRKEDDPDLRPSEEGLWLGREQGFDNELLLITDPELSLADQRSCLEWLSPRRTSLFTEVDRIDSASLLNLVWRLKSVQPRLSRLGQLDLFKGIDEDSLAIAAACFRDRLVKAGDTLCEEGDPADALFVVEVGRFHALRDGTKIGELGAGDVAGEMGLVSDTATRTATLRAKRDSLVLALDRDQFEVLRKRIPKVYDNLAQIMVQRIHGSQERPKPTYTFAMMFLSEDQDHTPLFDNFMVAFSQALVQMGRTRIISAQEVEQAFGPKVLNSEDGELSVALLAEWLQRQEQRYDFLLLVADRTISRWNSRIFRQADRVLFVGVGSQDPRPGSNEHHATEVFRKHDVRTDLILIHPEDATSGHNTRAWLEHRPFLHRHHHVRDCNLDDAARVVRLLSNRAIGLSFSGVSSRAVAHVGVIRALQERGIPIDTMVGVSSGAGIAAMVAMNLPWQDIFRLSANITKEAIPKLSYFTLPYSAFMSGRQAVESIQRIFEDHRFEDQFISCRVMAADLRSSSMVSLDAGEIWLGVRASSSLPLIWPPVAVDGRVLVDGGMLNNTPLQYLGEEVRHGWKLVSDPNPAFEPFSEVVDYGASLSGWRALWERLRGGDPGRYPALGETVIQGMCVESFRQQAIADRSKGTPRTVFFNKGIVSPGFFGVREESMINQLMMETYEDALAKLAEHPEIPTGSTMESPP